MSFETYISESKLGVTAEQKAAVKALSKESTPPGIYNIGSGKGYSLNEIISIFESQGIEREVKFIKSRYIDVPVNILDIKKIQEDNVAL